MLGSTDANAPQSGRMSPPVNAPSSNETGTYLSTGDPHENDNCRFEDGAQRSVTPAHTSNLLATADSARQDSQGNTPLCLAAQAGNLVGAQQLILRGADVHHINLNGDNALTLAAAGGHLTFIEWLDSHCRQPVDHENYYAETALTLAARHGHQPVVQWLVNRDASLTHLNDRLRDALAEAVAKGHLALAQWLSSQDIDLRRVYPDGNNLFLHAVRAGHQKVAQWLEDSGVDSQQVNELGCSAFVLAARRGHHQLLARLLAKNAAGIQHICRNGDSPLLIAARHGHGETVKLLVQHGADKRLVNHAGSSVLTLAAASSESLALWLCKKGTDIHHIEYNGDNAFTRAAQSGFFQLMQTLERLGINIHQVNRNNDNAFTLVARQGSLPGCQWLAGKGINIHQVNRWHHNAVTLAALAGSLPLLQWLCAEDVDWQQIPKIPTCDTDFPRIIEMPYSFNAAILAASAGHFTEAQWLMQRGLSIHERDYYGRNAIIQAVQQGKLKSVQWLSAQGIMPDSFPDEFLDYFKCPQYNAMGMAARLGRLHILQWLHQNGGLLGTQDDGRDLLTLAARRGDLPMTQWLCRQGADIDRLNPAGTSALSEAISCGHLRLSQWLVGQGARDIPGGHNDALMRATRGGHNAIFRWLIRSEYPNDQLANDLLLCAVRCGHRSLAVWLCLNVCNRICGVDNNNRNALMLAAKHGFLWLMQWLSEQTVDINQATHKGYTALMLAAANGHLPVVQWLYLEKNANLHRKNHNKADALHIAIINGHTETANWLIDQGMVLNPKYFPECTERRAVRWTRNRNNVGLLQCLLRQQLPLRLLVPAMAGAARNGDVAVLTCCLSAGVRMQFTNCGYNRRCCQAAAESGSLATLEFLRHYSGRGIDNEKKISLASAARYGNLHVIQWFWLHGGLSKDEKDCCLLIASFNGHFHVVKWLCRQGADIWVKNDRGHSSLSTAVSHGNLPMLRWFCPQPEDICQIEENGKGALLLAILAHQPHVALWLLRRGITLTKRDIQYALNNFRKRMLGMIFKLTPRIRRADLFHSSSLVEKLRLVHALQLYGDDENPSEEEADASFARFNQCNHKTLEQKCLLAVARIIEQRSGSLEARFDAVDSLPISSDSKGSLWKLVGINLAK